MTPIADYGVYIVIEKLIDTCLFLKIMAKTHVFCKAIKANNYILIFFYNRSLIDRLALDYFHV